MGNTLLAILFGKIIGLVIGATFRIVAGVCRLFVFRFFNSLTDKQRAALDRWRF